MRRLGRALLRDRRDPRRVLAEEFAVPMPESGSPPREALAWARRICSETGIEPSREPLKAIRALRRERDLGLKPAAYLVRHLEHDPRP